MEKSIRGWAKASFMTHSFWAMAWLRMGKTPGMMTSKSFAEVSS